jgi:hypothetical protein
MITNSITFESSFQEWDYTIVTRKWKDGKDRHIPL